MAEFDSSMTLGVSEGETEQLSGNAPVSILGSFSQSLFSAEDSELITKHAESFKALAAEVDMEMSDETDDDRDMRNRGNKQKRKYE